MVAAVRSQQRAKVEVQNRVAVEHDKGLTIEECLHLLDATASIEDWVFRRIGEAQAVETPIAQGCRDLLT